MNNILCVSYVCMIYITFYLFIWIYGHLDSFHVLAIVNKERCNEHGVLTLLWYLIFVSFGYAETEAGLKATQFYLGYT